MPFFKDADTTGDHQHIQGPAPPRWGPSEEEETDFSPQERVECLTELHLMRSFERRLWEVDVPVNGIQCICFGLDGPPYSPTRESSQYSVLVSRANQASVIIMEEQQDGQFLPGVTLLVQRVGLKHVNLTVVEVVTGRRDLRVSIFDEPILKEDFDTVMMFIVSYKQWSQLP